jgi:hypothetical protein
VRSLVGDCGSLFGDRERVNCENACVAQKDSKTKLRTVRETAAQYEILFSLTRFSRLGELESPAVKLVPFRGR